MNFIELLKDCQDEFGRITEGYGLGHDNPKLFNAYFLILLKLNKLDTSAFERVIQEDLKATNIVQGLWSRHTKAYREKRKFPHNPMSHDECNGITMYGVDHFTKDMLYYLRNNNYCYADTLIGARPLHAFMQRPISFIKELYAFYKAVKNNPEDEDGQDAKFSKDVVALRYIRRPRDTGFYKLMIGEKLNAFEYLDFHLSWLFSLFFSYKEGAQNSGTYMNAFKLIALALKGYKWPLKFFASKMKERLGDKWLYEMSKLYFYNPIHTHKTHVNVYLSYMLKDDWAEKLTE